MFTWFFSLYENMRGVETWACGMLDQLLGQLFKNIIHPQAFVATITAMTQLFSFMLSRTPIQAFGDELDLTGYELVYEDEFEGDSLNMNDWHIRANGKTGVNGCYGADTISVKDGNLIIEAKYLENGSHGSGWYGAEIALNEKYTYGYFEIRTICGKGPGPWSCFWMQSDNSYNADISQGGPGGSEIDILEANAQNSDIAKGADAILECVHVNGGPNDKTETSDTSGAVYFYGNNIYEEYNTYGVLWNEEEYIFYVNGVESLRTAWREGASHSPEEVIVSVCIPNQDLDKVLPRDFVSTMKVDYVKIYQLAQAGK